MDSQAVAERDAYGRATMESLIRVFGGNCTILDAAVKLDDHMETAQTMVVSISGGSDSDIMLDLVEAIRPIHPDLEIHYVWFNTGMEYEATRRHLEYLEQRYKIKIERRPAKVPVPAGCKKFGLPFLSKQVSQAIHRLQRNGFQWEDEPFDVLLAKYPKCASALKWWCGEKWDNRFTIYRNKWLKEFMVANPPDFEISDGCCHGAKKYTAAAVVKDYLPCIQCIGIRKAEGGLRGSIQTCFSPACLHDPADKFRPIFWFTDGDKVQYEVRREIVHSDCYTKYGFRRTGCAACPFGREFEAELEALKRFKPKMYRAAIGVFEKSYEYTRKYREFCKVMNEREKLRKIKDAGQITLDELAGVAVP